MYDFGVITYYTVYSYNFCYMVGEVWLSCGSSADHLRTAPLRERTHYMYNTVQLQEGRFVYLIVHRHF